HRLKAQEHSSPHATTAAAEGAAETARPAAAPTAPLILGKNGGRHQEAYQETDHATHWESTHRPPRFLPGDGTLGEGDSLHIARRRTPIGVPTDSCYVSKHQAEGGVSGGCLHWIAECEHIPAIHRRASSSRNLFICKALRARRYS